MTYGRCSFVDELREGFDFFLPRRAVVDHVMSLFGSSKPSIAWPLLSVLKLHHLYIHHRLSVGMRSQEVHESRNV